MADYTKIIAQRMQEDKTLDPALLVSKCQSIYLNLLLILDEEKESIPATLYAREFMQTARCDSVGRDRTVDRLEFERFLTPDVNRRILSYNQTPRDDEHASQALFHYATWHSKQHFKALTPGNQVWYYLLYKPQVLLAGIGFMSVPYGGWRASMRLWKTRSQKNSL